MGDDLRRVTVRACDMNFTKLTELLASFYGTLVDKKITYLDSVCSMK
jgi:hypothetical protein